MTSDRRPRLLTGFAGRAAAAVSRHSAGAPDSGVTEEDRGGSSLGWGSCPRALGRRGAQNNLTRRRNKRLQRLPEIFNKRVCYFCRRLLFRQTSREMQQKALSNS